jgi:hypothetical protein
MADQSVHDMGLSLANHSMASLNNNDWFRDEHVYNLGQSDLPWDFFQNFGVNILSFHWGH